MMFPAKPKRVPLKGRVDIEFTRSECTLLADLLDAEGSRRFKQLPPRSEGECSAIAFIEWLAIFEFHPVPRSQLLCDELRAKAQRVGPTRTVPVQFVKPQALAIGRWLEEVFTSHDIGLMGVDLSLEMRSLADKLIGAATRKRGRQPATGRVQI